MGAAESSRLGERKPPRPCTSHHEHQAFLHIVFTNCTQPRLSTSTKKGAANSSLHAETGSREETHGMSYASSSYFLQGYCGSNPTQQHLSIMGLADFQFYPGLVEHMTTGDAAASTLMHFDHSCTAAHNMCISVCSCCLPYSESRAEAGHCSGTLISETRFAHNNQPEADRGWVWYHDARWKQDWLILNAK